MKALASAERLAIMATLAERAMSLPEIHARLANRRYRSSIYRDLEVLKAAGLVNKAYDDETKSLRYQVSTRRIELELR